MSLRSTAAATLVAVTMLTGCSPSATTPGTDLGGQMPAGCPSGAEPVPSLAVIQGNRAGTQRVPLRLLDCYIGEPTLAVHSVVVVSDGSVTQAEWDRRWAPSPDHPRSERQALGEYLRGLAAALDAPARHAESNPLEAISVAARALSRDGGRRVILVNDNLVQTAGRLPFQNGYLYADPDDIVNQLTPGLDRAGVDLTGIEIVLMAAGTSSGDQPAFDTEQRAMLVRLWTTLLTSRGAEVTEFTGAEFEAFSAPSLPSVAPVPLTEPAPPVVAQKCTAVLTPGKVGFVPDRTTFIEPEAARETIRTAARQMSECPGVVKVTGTTASGGNEAYRMRLSQGRAEAVRAVLADELGVPASSIEAVGVGTHSPYHVEDLLPDNSLDPVKAQMNRLVIIESVDR